jgi:hypothetical protein
MPLRDKPHDDVLCTFITRTSATATRICQKLTAEQLQTRASSIRSVREGGMDRPLQKQISPGYVTLLHPARRAPVLGHLSILRPHCFLFLSVQNDRRALYRCICIQNFSVVEALQSDDLVCNGSSICAS